MRATGASGRIYGSRPQAAPRGLGAVSLAQRPSRGVYVVRQRPILRALKAVFSTASGDPLFLDTWEQVEKTKPHAGCSPIRHLKGGVDGPTRKHSP